MSDGLAWGSGYYSHSGIQANRGITLAHTFTIIPTVEREWVFEIVPTQNFLWEVCVISIHILLTKSRHMTISNFKRRAKKEKKNNGKVIQLYAQQEKRIWLSVNSTSDTTEW